MQKGQGCFSVLGYGNAALHSCTFHDYPAGLQPYMAHDGPRAHGDHLLQEQPFWAKGCLLGSLRPPCRQRKGSGESGSRTSALVHLQKSLVWP